MGSLNKLLYDLNQASRQWLGEFTGAIIAIGFTQFKVDYSLFTCSSEKSYTALLIYVDNIVITSNDVGAINSLKDFLHTRFLTKDLRNLKYFLRIEVSRSKGSIYISQRKYALEILKNQGFFGS